MSVPTPLIFHPAGIDLHETHSSFDHASRGEALTREVIASLLAYAIEFFDMLRLAVDIESFRRGILHPVSQLKTLNPSLQFRITGTLFDVLVVEFLQQG